MYIENFENWNELQKQYHEIDNVIDRDEFRELIRKEVEKRLSEWMERDKIYGQCFTTRTLSNILQFYSGKSTEEIDKAIVDDYSLNDLMKTFKLSEFDLIDVINKIEDFYEIKIPDSFIDSYDTKLSVFIKFIKQYY